MEPRNCWVFWWRLLTREWSTEPSSRTGSSPALPSESVIPPSSCRRRQGSGDQCPARFMYTFLTWIKLIDGHCKMARERCMNRWRWTTENALPPCGIHLETTGILPPIVESELMESRRTVNAGHTERVARESV